MSPDLASRKERAAGTAQASWAQGLLTLVSIMLGAAVAVGAQKTLDISANAGLDLTTVIRALAAFMFITGSYYHCYTVVSFFFILPSLLWVILATAVGVGVIMSAYTIDSTSQFLVSSMVFYLAGALVFGYAVQQHRSGRIGLLTEESIDENEAYESFVREVSKNCVCFLLMLFITFLEYLSYDPSVEGQFFGPEFLLIVLNLVIYGIMVWFTEYRFLPAVQKVWSIDSAKPWLRRNQPGGSQTEEQAQ